MNPDTWPELLAKAGLDVPTRERVDRVGFTPAERRALDKHYPRETPTDD